MDANLVGAPSFNLDLQQRKLSIFSFNPLEHLPMRDRCATKPASARGHTRPPNRITADGSTDRSLCLRHPAMHQPQAGLFHLPPTKLLSSPAPHQTLLLTNNYPP